MVRFTFNKVLTYYKTYNSLFCKRNTFSSIKRLKERDKGNFFPGSEDFNFEDFKIIYAVKEIQEHLRIWIKYRNDMFKSSFQNIVLAVILLISSLAVSAQKVTEPKTKAEWSQPYKPFRTAGNLYYVGTYDLSCYLIITTKGNILINTGLAASAAQIKSNIETLGFNFADTKILLTSQAHYDHVGAMATIEKMTGAKFMADEKDAEVLATGGTADYELGKYGITFKPITADRLLHDSDTISLGNMQLVMLHHPGHTKGSCSFLFTVKDDQRSYKVLIANMPTIITERSFAAISAYPDIAEDYAYTLKAMKNISFDIWLAAHASQFNLHEKHKPGDGYNPAAFTDQPGYDAAISDLQKQYDEKMQQKPAIQ
jgi:metallo-beta-lactamase class B